MPNQQLHLTPIVWRPLGQVERYVIFLSENSGRLIGGIKYKFHIRIAKMSFYQKIAEIGPRFIGKNKTFKFGFNCSPMYRRSTAKIIDVSEDLLSIRIKIPISYKNKNYVGSIFGGSMFSAVDPIPMVQLINLLENRYVVWDKSAEIFFRSPAREDLYAELTYTTEELEQIRNLVEQDNQIDFVKTTYLTDKRNTKIYCEVRKKLYISTKSYYKNKKKSAK